MQPLDISFAFIEGFKLLLRELLAMETRLRFISIRHGGIFTQVDSPLHSPFEHTCIRPSSQY